MTLMKKLVFLSSLLVLAMFLYQLALPAFSQNKYAMTTLLRATRDHAILNAFDMMQGTSAEGALDIVVKRKTRVFFKDLGEINKRVRDYDALSWISPKGEWVIFINEKHKNAPPEALVAVIAHEAIHNDPHNSMHEEIVAWHQEARVWLELKRANPRLASIPEGEIALVDRLNRLAREYEKGTLEALVRANKGYRDLPETSPGFTDIHARLNNPYLEYLVGTSESAQ